MLRKVKLSVILFLVLFAYPAQAGYRFADQWNWKDTLLEGAFTAEVFVDLGQSLYHIDTHEYSEINPFLPKYPSKNQIWEACIIGSAAHALISLAVPKHLLINGIDYHPRAWWQGTTLIIEGGNITRNKSLGIGWTW
jgi:hypothetical protein